MKTLDELGISPAPWHDLGHGIVGFANCENAMVAVLTSKTNMPADARLVAAAPELYEALREACRHLASFSDCDTECDTCKVNPDCMAHRWRAAIAKASGENEARVWCKHDPTRKCVDCEGCPDESEEER